MSKFHINKHGVPAHCKAKSGNCPLGGDAQHFDNIESAQEYADKQNEQQHGLLPGVEINKIPNLKQRGTMSNKEVQITLKNGEIIEGIANNNRNNDKSFNLRIDGNWHEDKEINLEDISELKQVSNESYFSKEYQNELRRVGKARPEFRYSEEKLSEFKNKFIEVNYDGKTFDGEVIGTRYNGHHDSGLIIQSLEDESIKHIKNHRLTDLEITADNPADHKSYQAMKRLANEFDVNDFTQMGEPRDSEFIDFNDPRDELNKYFKAVIAKHKGEDIDLNKYDYDWTDDVSNNRDEYKDTRDNDFTSYFSGDSSGEWSESSEEWYEEDIGKAEDINAFYEERKDFINHMVEKVERTDWTEYYATQKEGEIKALEYLQDIEIASDY